jgi:hypothetical protein
VGYVADGVLAIPFLVVCGEIVWAFWSVGKQKNYGRSEI